MKFEIGDKVTYINEQGVAFKGFSVIGFRTPELGRDGKVYAPERTVFINSSCYWFAKNPERLILEDKERNLDELTKILKERNPDAQPALCFGADRLPDEIPGEIKWEKMGLK